MLAACCKAAPTSRGRAHRSATGGLCARIHVQFNGLAAERPIRKDRDGVAMIEWLVDRGVRNEPLDCRVYATSALHGLYAVGYRLEAVTAASPVVVAGKSRWMAR